MKDHISAKRLIKRIGIDLAKKCFQIYRVGEDGEF